MMLINRIKIPKFDTKCISRPVSERRKNYNNVVTIPEAKRIAEPWNERKEVWKSKFTFLESRKPTFGPDFITLMQTPIDLSPKNVKKWYLNRMAKEEDYDQRFIKERFDILGEDLAAAHFIVHRGGAVKFVNESEWIKKKSDDSYILPNSYIQGLYVEAIDVKGIKLRRAGLENILDLSRLRWLNISDGPMIDDWSIDAISGSYGQTLQHLDMSRCSGVSHRALACFYRFEKLDTLVVEGISNSAEFQLSCMMLEDLKPTLTIKGINYTPPPPITEPPQ